MLNFACGHSSCIPLLFDVAVKLTRVFNPRFIWGKTNMLANGSPQATFPFNSLPGSRPVIFLIVIQANSLHCTCAYVLCTSCIP